MMLDVAPSQYDEIAGMYHALWADWYLPAAMPALEELFFSKVTPGTRVLDVCCGSGHVTKELLRRGYLVTAVDSSAGLIDLARKDLPGVDLRVMDARHLVFESPYDAAVSTFDSLNHILNIDELCAALSGVRQALQPGGLFVFDMNLEEAYTADLRQWSVNITDESVGLVRGTYDFGKKLASTELIWFKRAGSENWRRYSSIVEQRCYTESEIRAALSDAEFKRVQIVTAKEAGIKAELGFGRIFISAIA